MTVHNSPSPKITIIGLGLLGMAVARNFLEVGIRVAGTDLRSSPLGSLKNFGGHPFKKTHELWDEADWILTCLPDHRALLEVIDKIPENLSGKRNLIDLSTGSPESMKLAGNLLEEKGVAFLDGAVCGSSEAVREKEALILLGGPEETIQECAWVFKILSHSIYPAGGWGAAARMKLTVNLALGLHRAVLAEALSFAQAQNLDLNLTLQILQESPASSKVMEKKGPRMLNRNYAPEAKLSQHLKDIRLILSEGLQNQVSLPLSKLHGELMSEAEAAGWGDQDNSAIFEIFQRPLNA